MTLSRNPLRAAPAHGPAAAFAAVTPDDAADLPLGPPRALFVGAAGSLRIMDVDGRVATLESGPSQYHPVAASRVLAAGTTATGIVALY